MANHYQMLNGRQRAFIKLYTGHTPIAGNATRCYMAAYETATEFSAQRSSSHLMRCNPHIQAILAQAEERAMAQLTINAKYVLEESQRLYQRAMGDDSYEHIETNTAPDTGLERITVVEHRSYDPATARAALQLIGQHRDVQAFAVTVEHNHTHHLEQRLAARSKLIEGKASVIDDPATSLTQVPAIPDLKANQGGAVDPVDLTAVPGTEDEAHAAGCTLKRVHPSGGHDDRSRRKEVPARGSAGATAN